MASNNLVLNLLIKAKDKASGVFSKLKNNAGKVALAISAAFAINFFKNALGQAADFEKQMSVVGAISGAVGDKLQLLKDTAKEWGAKTKYTALQAAQGLEELARAGFDAVAQVKLLPKVLALATANKLSLAEAAGYVATTLKGFNLSVGNSSRVVDVLTKVSASAFTDVRKMGSAMSKVAPIARMMKLPLEKTVAIIASMQNANIDASSSGTMLKRMLLQFNDPANKFKQSLIKIGITTTNFSQALHELAGKPAHLARQAILDVGKIAGPGLVTLLNQGMPALDKLTQKLYDSKDAAKAAAKMMSDNYDGALTALGSSWDAIKLQLAEGSLEFLTETIRDVTEKFQLLVKDGSIEEFGKIISNSFKLIIEVTIKVVSVIKDFSGGLKSLLVLMAGAKVYSFVAAIRAVGVASTISSVGIGLAATATTLLAKAFNAIPYVLFFTLADQVRRLIGNLLELRETQNKNSLLEKSVQEQKQKVIERYREEAKQLGINANQYGITSDAISLNNKEYRKNLNTLIDAIDKKRELTSWSNEVKKGLDKEKDSVNRYSDSIAEMGSKAEDAQLQVLDAFIGMGITSSAELSRISEASKAHFQTISNNAESTQIDIQRAFIKMAEAQILANEGVIDGALKAEAAAHGVKLSADGAIKSQVELSRIASESKNKYEILKNTSSKLFENEKTRLEKIKTSFINYATAAISANDGIISASIKAEAAQLNIKIATDGTTISLGKELSATDKVAAAMERMGLKTRESLKKIATEAKEDFDTIRFSGTATTDQMGIAYKNYAEKAIAANNGIAKSSLLAMAAENNTVIAREKSGKTAIFTKKEWIKKLKEVAAEQNKVTKSVKKTTDALQGEAAAADQATGGMKRSKSRTIKGKWTMDSTAKLVIGMNKSNKILLDRYMKGMFRAAARPLMATSESIQIASENKARMQLALEKFIQKIGNRQVLSEKMAADEKKRLEEFNKKSLEKSKPKKLAKKEKTIEKQEPIKVFQPKKEPIKISGSSDDEDAARKGLENYRKSRDKNMQLKGNSPMPVSKKFVINLTFLPN